MEALGKDNPLLEVCARLIATDSSPDQGTLDVALAIHRIASEVGLHTRLLESHSGRFSEANILVSNRAEGLVGGPYLFQSHIDTAPPGHYSRWNDTDQNPFNFTLKGDRALGLGVVDAKADFACKLVSLAGQIKNEKPITLLGTFGGSRFELDGSRLFLAQHAAAIRYAMIGCPSNMQLVDGLYGATVLDIELPLSPGEAELRRQHLSDELTSTHSKVFKGKAAHSATPEKGENAIIKLMEYLSKLPDGVGIVNAEGGVADNVVPEEAFLEFDLTRTDHSRVRAWMMDCLAIMQEVERARRQIPESNRPIWNLGLLRHEEHAIRLGISLRFSPRSPFKKIGTWFDLLQDLARKWEGDVRERHRFAPFVTRRHGPLRKICHDVLIDMGLSTAPAVLAETNEAALFASYGIECVPIGPGLSEGNAHHPNESIPTAEIERASAFYSRVMGQLP